jgi:hypothetical protein
MNQVYLVACVAVKQNHPAPARELYISPWFQKARAYTERHAQRWYILSAGYGLLDPSTVISPYNTTLNNMGVAQRELWANQVFHELIKVTDPQQDKLIFLAGQKYREPLATWLANEGGYQIEVPMQSLTIGKQLQWLSDYSRASISR